MDLVQNSILIKQNLKDSMKMGLKRGGENQNIKREISIQDNFKKINLMEWENIIGKRKKNLILEISRKIKIKGGH